MELETRKDKRVKKTKEVEKKNKFTTNKVSNISKAIEILVNNGCVRAKIDHGKIFFFTMIVFIVDMKIYYLLQLHHVYILSYKKYVYIFIILLHFIL